VEPAGRIAATREEILAEGVILCVRLGPQPALLELCRAAVRGGLRVLELTLTTPRALEAMAELAREQGALVGGGTVLCLEDVRSVDEAGGRFVFSPVFDPEVFDEASGRGLLAVPGASTPAEILAAHRHGARLVKVFPAGALGGADYLRAVRGPLPEVDLVPTSGPGSQNAVAYFAAGARAVGVGAEVFHDGSTPESVEAAARRVRCAVDAARAGRAAQSPEVRVTPLPTPHGIAQGVSCRWEGGQYVAIVARHGLVGCGIFDREVCDRFGFAVAMAHGTPAAPLAEPPDVLDAVVDTVSPAAAKLGVEPGMKGSEALARLMAP
jgi:2-dehydro-3-deoxyphosphogluconate aldolase/(4S)-4-hydroxy-2-oxoglutarate aldolase